MPEIPPETLASIEARFHDLIRERAGDLIDAEGLELPHLARLLDSDEPKAWFAVPGMYGGFSYWFEGEGGGAKLISESWSRVVGGSGQRHEITAQACTLVDEGFV